MFYASSQELLKSLYKRHFVTLAFTRLLAHTTALVTLSTLVLVKHGQVGKLGRIKTVENTEYKFTLRLKSLKVTFFFFMRPSLSLALPLSLSTYCHYFCNLLSPFKFDPPETLKMRKKAVDYLFRVFSMIP